jgi:hypothetical protein
VDTSVACSFIGRRMAMAMAMAVIIVNYDER